MPCARPALPAPSPDPAKPNQGPLLPLPLLLTKRPLIAASQACILCLCLPDKKPSPLAEEDKVVVREMIVEGIVRAPHSVKVQLSECVRSMIYCDYPDKWPQLLQQVYVLLTSQARMWALAGGWDCW